MKLLLKRALRRDGYTVGELYIDGDLFCHTMEDTDRGLKQSDPLVLVRKQKVPGRTAIPTGVYGVATTMSARFKREMPLIKDVPGFSGVRIHSGNTAADTEGCVLLGEWKSERPDRLTNSRKTVAAFEERLRAAGGEAELIIC